MKRLTALSFGTRQPEDSQKTRLTYSTETSENTNRQSFIHVYICLCIRNRRTQTLVARFTASPFKVVRGGLPRAKALTVKNHTRSHQTCFDGEPDATPGANTARRARNRTIQLRTPRTHHHHRIASIASSSSSRASNPRRIHPRPDSSPSENLVVHHPRRVASTLSNTYVSSRPGGLVAAVGTALLRHLRVLKQTYSRRRRRLTSSSVSIFPAESRAMVRIESTTRGRSSNDTREEDETRVRMNSNPSLASSSSSCSFKSSSSHTHAHVPFDASEREAFSSHRRVALELEREILVFGIRTFE